MSLRRQLLVTGALAVSALAGGAAEAGAAELVNATNVGVPSQAGSTQTGRIDPVGGSASQCEQLEFSPSAIQTNSTFRYTNHTFRSRLTHSICVTAELTPACAPAVPLYSAAYIGAFVPSDVLANYAAHSGTAGPPQAYSFAPPGESTFAIVVHTTTPDTDCSSYALRVTSLGPWATTAPAVVGNAPAVGSSITGNNAQWVTTPAAPTVARRWRRCDAQGAACTDIPGATGQTYAVTNDDLGHTLRFRNVAEDTDGTSTSDSAFVEPFIPFETHATESLGPGDRVHNGIFVRDNVDSHCSAPKSAPTVLQPIANFLYDPFPAQSLLNDPVCLVARTLPGPGCGTGVSPSIYGPAFDPPAGIPQNYVGNSGTPFSSAGFASVPLPPAARREVVVSIGSSVAVCASYNVTLGADAPFALVRPTVAGAPAEGVALTAADGTWSGTPAFGYAWLRCDADGGACASIDGATAASYTPTAADAGSRLRVRVTATQGRSVSSDSEPTSAVAAAPPSAGGGPGGPGGPGGTNPPPLDRTAPKATVKLGSRDLAKAVKSGRVPVTVTCDEDCAATVEVRITRKLAKQLKLGKKVVIARAKGSLKPVRKTTLRPKLASRTRRALRRRTSLTLSIAATFTDPAGNAARKSVKASLKRPRRR